jgi:hypothetical protein
VKNIPEKKTVSGNKELVTQLIADYWKKGTRVTSLSQSWKALLIFREAFLF